MARVKTVRLDIDPIVDAVVRQFVREYRDDSDGVVSRLREVLGEMEKRSGAVIVFNEKSGRFNAVFKRAVFEEVRDGLTAMCLFAGLEVPSGAVSRLEALFVE